MDLVYLDPPFNSNASYNVLFAEHDGTQAASQIKAFEDTWKWDESAARACTEVIEAGGKVSEAMQAFRTFLGRLRHDGLPRDDGPAPGGAAPRAVNSGRRGMIADVPSELEGLRPGSGGGNSL